MSLYREREQTRARHAEMQAKDLQAWRAAETKRRMEVAQEETPEARLRRNLVQALSSHEAVVVMEEGGVEQHKIGPGHIASGTVFSVRIERLTRRELWYANENGEVLITASVDGVSKGADQRVIVDDVQRRTLRLDDVASNQRLVFPGGFMYLPGNPRNAFVESLDGNRWKTVATAKQQSPEYLQLLNNFVGLWQKRGSLTLTQVR